MVPIEPVWSSFRLATLSTPAQPAAARFFRSTGGGVSDPIGVGGARPIGAHQMNMAPAPARLGTAINASRPLSTPPCDEQAPLRPIDGEA